MIAYCVIVSLWDALVAALRDTPANVRDYLRRYRVRGRHRCIPEPEPEGDITVLFAAKAVAFTAGCAEALALAETVWKG